jgi:hypothetical protein
MPDHLPVYKLIRVRDHEFKRRRPKKDLEKGQHDLCACGYGKHNPIHHAFPESTRTWGSGAHRGAYQGMNTSWKKVLTEGLVAIDLPTGLERVSVEARYTWGEKYGSGPDLDNFRYPCSKFLADALVDGGWLPDDGWSDEIHDWRFEFGGLAYDYSPGVFMMELDLYPIARSVQDELGDNPFLEGVFEGNGHVDVAGAAIDA